MPIANEDQEGTAGSKNAAVITRLTENRERLMGIIMTALDEAFAGKPREEVEAEVQRRIAALYRQILNVGKTETD